MTQDVPMTQQKWMVFDDFCPEIDLVRASALASGFGTWRPNKGEVGSSVYDNMNFWGLHAFMLKSIDRVLGARFYPNDTFFRYAVPETEPAYTHSDRAFGDITCVCYMSDHDEVFGTGFYRHRKTGLTEMPKMEDMVDPEWDELKRDMIEGGPDEWDEVGFCEGMYNRAVIFHAPLFHARYPKTGIGTNATDARMVWAAHGIL